MYTLYDLADYSRPISYFKDAMDISALDEQILKYTVYPFSSTTPLAKSIEIINALHYDGISIVDGRRKHIRCIRLEDIKERSETNIFYRHANDDLSYINLESRLISELR